MRENEHTKNSQTPIIWTVRALRVVFSFDSRCLRPADNSKSSVFNAYDIRAQLPLKNFQFKKIQNIYRRVRDDF